MNKKDHAYFFIYSPFSISKFLKAGINRTTSRTEDNNPPCNHSVELRTTKPWKLTTAVANALAVAKHLQSHPAVSWVNYPGLDESPNKAIADSIFTGRGYGGLVSFGIKGGREAGQGFIEALGLFSHLANIGDAKSLAIHNATTTHSQLTADELAAAGVPEDMVRLSVGIEHVEDLIADLDQALAAAAK